MFSVCPTVWAALTSCWLRLVMYPFAYGTWKKNLVKILCGYDCCFVDFHFISQFFPACCCSRCCCYCCYLHPQLYYSFWLSCNCLSVCSTLMRVRPMRRISNFARAAAQDQGEQEEIQQSTWMENSKSHWALWIMNWLLLLWEMRQLL